MLHGIFPGIEILFPERDSVRLRPITDEGLVSVTFFSAQMEIAMGNLKMTSCGRARGQVSHDHGVDPAAYGKQDRPTPWKQSLETSVETGLHHGGNYFFLVVKE